MMQDVHVELNLGLPWQKAGFYKKKTFFHPQIGLKLKEKTGKVLHLERSFGAGMCKLRKVVQEVPG